MTVYSSNTTACVECTCWFCPKGLSQPTEVTDYQALGISGNRLAFSLDHSISTLIWYTMVEVMKCSLLYFKKLTPSKTVPHNNVSRPHQELQRLFAIWQVCQSISISPHILVFVMPARFQSFCSLLCPWLSHILLCIFPAVVFFDCHTCGVIKSRSLWSLTTATPVSVA